MSRTVIVRGHVVGSRTVELEEPVPAGSEVEVILRIPDETSGSPDSVAEFLRSLPPGTRTKEDIDRQIQEERDSWDA